MAPKKPIAHVPLERAFSKLGIASRSQARKLIEAGHVAVNGKIQNDPLFLVVPEKVKLAVDGEPCLRASWRTILLYKPKGLVTTKSDEKGRATIYSLLPPELVSLHCVGRLDMATSGLLLLTNDTRLSDWLTEPANNVKRIYTVTVQGEVSEQALAKMREGVHDQGEFLRPDFVELRKASRVESHLTIHLHEGKNREIRRLCAAVNHEVRELKRVAFGGLTLDHVLVRNYREVTQEEIVKAFPGVEQVVGRSFGRK